MSRTTRSPARHLCLILLVALLGVSTARAQLETITYQGYLTDADGVALDEDDATLIFRLYDSAEGGTVLWIEKQTGVSIVEGVFAVQLGSVESLPPALFGQSLFLSVAVGDDQAAELDPRVPLTAVPYSLRARSLDDAALAAGENVTIERDGDALQIAAAGGLLAPAATAGGAFYDGNVGVGTDTPLARLHVQGGDLLIEDSFPFIQLDGTQSNKGIQFRQQGQEQGSLIFSNPVGLRMRADATEMALHRQGGVGIGTTAPQGALHVTEEALDIDDDGFSDDALVVEGDRPVIGIYGRFQVDTRPGLVLAGVNNSGTVVDKWGLVREYFGTNRLHFTYGLDEDHTQNPTAMSLSTDGPTAATFTATDDLGEDGTPLPGRRFRDNVVYAWAHVNFDGSVVDSYGCTVSKQLGNGQYRVKFKRDLPNGVSAIVTPKGANDPVIATVVANSTFADVKTKVFNGTAFTFFDSGFYIQVVGRP